MIHPKDEPNDDRYLNETFGKMDELYEHSVSAATDAVEHPSHYQIEPFVCREVLDIIDAFNLDFNTGNVVKYTLRAALKPDEIRGSDLRKALFYAGRAIGLNQIGTIRVELQNADELRGVKDDLEEIAHEWAKVDDADSFLPVVAALLRAVLDQL